MSVELALAIIGAVDVGLKWGEQIRELCAALKDAPKGIAERVVRVEACWMRISVQLDFSRRIADLMEDDHRQLHHRTLDILLDKLRAVHRELHGIKEAKAQGSQTQQQQQQQQQQQSAVAVTEADVTGPSLTTQRIKYAFKKKKIDEAIEDLEKWQGVFDISWLLTLKIANREIDDAAATSPVGSVEGPIPLTMRLRSAIHKTPAMTAASSAAAAAVASRVSGSVFLREDGLGSAAVSPLPFCEAAVVERKGELLVLDRIVCPDPSAARVVTKDVRSLAQSMGDAHHPAGSFGWMRCKGVIRETKADATSPATSLTMVFKVPPGLSRPRSLRASLVEGDHLTTLSHKIQIAKDLARAVSYVHIFDFVHKNIRPETILLADHPSSSSSSAPSVFLVGFEKFRREHGISYRRGDQSWARNLYLHPRRQGRSPQDTYVMQHDIYSLGACLLEIGLWRSFIEYDTEDESMPADVTLSGLSALANCHFSDIHRRFLALAQDELPKRMGTKYAEVARTCLTCLDEDNENFSDENEFADENGIVVGVRYVEKVIMQLNSISV